MQRGRAVLRDSGLNLVPQKDHPVEARFERRHILDISLLCADVLQHPQQGVYAMNDRRPGRRAARSNRIHVQRVEVARQSCKARLIRNSKRP
jgi:hypothetical protein